MPVATFGALACGAVGQSGVCECWTRVGRDLCQALAPSGGVCNTGPNMKSLSPPPSRMSFFPSDHLSCAFENL
ncbi:hypothetical protein M405DRAFT_811004 [Rhizopogon salebrosus TDB-379]|nr:hypothetical protein M405DRAFT_811004 [Rhizopogon salebrosus TDB-379]